MPRSSRRLDGLCERRLREREREVMHEAGLARRGVRVRLPLLVREHGDEPPVAGIEVEMALRRVVEVRLLEDERHAEHALPEVDRRLPVRAVDRDVVDALALDLAHRHHRSTSVDLYSLRARLPHGTSSTLASDDEHAAQSLTDRLRELRVRAAPRRQLDDHGKRRLLLHAGRPRLDEDVAAHPRRERSDDVADRRREDVHAAHDEHVVGAADAAHPRASPSTGARARAHLDVIACAEPDHRSSLMPEMRQDQLA